MKIIVKVNYNIIKWFKVLSNILKYIINDFNVIAILYKDFILKNKLRSFK